MGLTVKEALLRLNIDSDRVVAGKAGLEKVIYRVNILEVPDIIQWLDGGELLLTTGFALKDNPELQISLIKELAKKDVAALAIKAGRYLSPIPQVMLDLAEDLALPLIELPKDLPLSRVMAPIYEIILNEQLDKLKYTEEIHRHFLEIILKDQGMTEIGNTLTNLVKNPVAIMDTRFQLLYQTNLDTEVFPWPDILEAVKKRATNSYPKTAKLQTLTMTIFKYKDWDLLIYPIMNSRVYLGFIVVIHCEPINPVQENMACEQAALVSALEITKQNAIFHAECRNKEEIIEELLYGSLSSPDSIKRRASALNFSMDKKLVIFVVEWGKAVPINQANLVKEVEQLFTGYEGGVLCHLRGNQLVGLTGAQDQVRMGVLLGQIATKVSAEITKEVTIGVGRPYEELKDIIKSYEEGKIAVVIGKSLQKNNVPHFFAELGSLLCLYEMKESAKAKSFYKDTIGPIKDYDQKNATQLLFTLETYFNNHCILRRTARALYMHRNSLDYRLKKIAKLTGKDFLNNPYDKFDLELALRLEQIITNP